MEGVTALAIAQELYPAIFRIVQVCYNHNLCLPVGLPVCLSVVLLLLLLLMSMGMGFQLTMLTFGLLTTVSQFVSQLACQFVNQLVCHRTTEGPVKDIIFSLVIAGLVRRASCDLAGAGIVVGSLLLYQEVCNTCLVSGVCHLSGICHVCNIHHVLQLSD